MSLDNLKVILALDEIKYKNGWVWEAKYIPVMDVWMVEVNFWRQDAETGEFGWSQNMRKWPVENERSVDYLVNTVYKAIETAEVHEMREAFRYKGKPRFDPHHHD